jgi:hypothetical protein
VFVQESERIRIAWDLSAVGSGVDCLMTCLLCQQVNPAILGTISVTEESSWIIAVSIGISETQDPHRNHLQPNLLYHGNNKMEEVIVKK